MSNVEEFIKKVEQKLDEEICSKKGHDWEISDRFAVTCKRCNKTRYY